MISVAWAQDAATTAANGGFMGLVFSYLPLALIFVVFWMMVVRPQNKAAKEHSAMLAALKSGDYVQLAGGLVGVVKHVGEKVVRVQLDKETSVSVMKPAVQSRFSDEEGKALFGTHDPSLAVVDVTARKKK